MSAKPHDSRSSDGHNVSRETGITGPDQFQAHFKVSDETIGKLNLYASLLTQWQKTINLVSPSTLDQVWSRHFADSAQLLQYMPPLTKSWLDLGSGAGFPGLVVAIMLNDATIRNQIAASAPLAAPIKITLLESDQRKCAFLREVARQTGSNGAGAVVDIVAGRIELPATQSRVGLQDVISARALAPLSELINYASAYAKPQTVCLFLKGRDAERELEQALIGRHFKSALHQSLTDPEARVVAVSELQTLRA
jgi:16S rRNA (guanine527-N7)-methyltransferase